MLEKSGTILLTQDDIDESSKGNVSDRVKSTWGFTLQQLQDIIRNGEYSFITS